MKLIDPKQFYENYRADNTIDELDIHLVDTLLSFNPKSAFEFGSGAGKNLQLLKSHDKDIETCGLDISIINVMQSHLNGVDCVIRGDERHIPLRKFDVVFTCSVLDHIKDIYNIIGAFQAMTNKAIVLAETNSFKDNFYYKHNYEEYGFEKLDYRYTSTDDGGIYEIWVYKTPEYLESIAPVEFDDLHNAGIC